MSDLIFDDLPDSDSPIPSRYNFLNSLDLTKDVKGRIRNNLDQIVRGSNEVYRSPIAKDSSPSKLLSDVDLIFNNCTNINGDLKEFELQNRLKFGPRSIQSNWDKRENSLMDYFEPPKIEFGDLKIPVNKPRLRPIGIDLAISLLKNSTNSGLPYYTRKSKVKGIIKTNFKDLLSKEYPCILFTRTQESGKTRNVWGYPIADTLNEMLYYQPLLKYQKELKYRVALKGPDFVDKSISEFIMKARDNKDLTLLSIDFSSYDSTVGPYLISKAFDYIMSLFNTSFHDDIAYIRDRFINIGIITPSGVLSGDHGIPSGATFTNEVGSIVQFLLLHNFGEVVDYLIQGDDGEYLIQSSLAPKLISFLESFGLKVNIDKSYNRNDMCVYLQRFYHLDYLKDGFVGGIYSIYRAVNRIIFQERFINFEDFGLTGRDYYSIRTISILENCKYNPCFKELVQLVHSWDKYNLEYSENSLNSYINMITNGSGTGGLLYNQFGDNIKGISSFETVKILKGLH